MPHCQSNRALNRAAAVLTCGALLALLGATGCAAASGWRSAAPPKPPPAEVMVSQPVTATITDFEDFTGRTEAMLTVDIRARATGYLAKRHFTEGSEVEKGQLLFEIDPRPYQAEVDRAEANLNQAIAHLKRLDLDYNRSINLTTTKALSPQEFDKVAGDRAEGAAAVDVARRSWKRPG